MHKEIWVVDESKESPLALEIVASDKGISAIDCIETLEDKWKSAVREVSKIEHPIIRHAATELSEYFKGERKVFTVPIDLKSGTEFQKKAWDELCLIPYGKTISYGEQARKLGNPKATRAVGGANGKNPIPIIIPCHRVISSVGKLHGFSGGIGLKKRLLKIEGVAIDA